jgi:hypothetical protein
LGVFFISGGRTGRGAGKREFPVAEILKPRGFREH